MGDHHKSKSSNTFSGLDARDFMPGRKSSDRKSMFYAIRRRSTVVPQFDHSKLLDHGEMFKEAIQVLSKSNRSLKDNNAVMTFLRTLEPLKKLLKEAIKNKDINSENDDLLKNVSFVIRSEIADKHKVLFRLGDIGEKFYIILKGTVAILVPREIKVELSEENYYKYLIKLRKYGETELLSRTIFINKFIYPLHERDFDVWMKNRLELNKKIMMGSAVTEANVMNETAGKKSFYSRTSRSTLKLDKDLSEVVSSIHDSIALESQTLSIEEYIHRITPDNYNNHYESKLVTIFTYYHVNSLSKGECFGDIALDSVSHKRSATLIPLEQTYLGTMDRYGYTECIRDLTDKIKKENLNFILSHNIFEKANRTIFIRSFYSFFILRKFSRGDKIMVEGMPQEYIYIIKSGEFVIHMKKSIIEINEFIKEVCEGSEKHISETEKHFDIESMFESTKFFKHLTDRKDAKIAIIKGHEILGLEDTISKGKNFFTVECTSQKAEIFEINATIFHSLCNTDKHIKERVNEYSQLKKKNIAKRLQTIKVSRVQFYNAFQVEEIGEKNAIATKKKKKNNNMLHNIFKGHTKKKENISKG